MPAQSSGVPDSGVPEWFVYVLVSVWERRTYVGVTHDLRRRLEQHNGARPGGAKSTRGARPWRIGATHGPYPNRGSAQQAEAALKRIRGLERLRAEPLTIRTGTEGS